MLYTLCRPLLEIRSVFTGLLLSPTVALSRAPTSSPQKKIKKKGRRTPARWHLPCNLLEVNFTAFKRSKLISRRRNHALQVPKPEKVPSSRGKAYYVSNGARQLQATHVR